MVIEIIGYIATFVIAFSLTPQLVKSYKTRSTKDISVIWTFVYLFGLLLWFVYGIGIASKPLIISSFIEALMAASLLVMKVKYK